MIERTMEQVTKCQIAEKMKSWSFVDLVIVGLSRDGVGFLVLGLRSRRV
jgi:hypothetical protein